MQWSADDTVRIFGAAPTSGRFMDGVRDRDTGRYLGYRTEGKEFFEQLRDLLGSDPPNPIASVVAVLDTGMVHEHPLVRGRILEEVDFTGEGVEDLSGHGTIVTLFLLADRSVPLELLNVKVVNQYGRGSPEDLVNGLLWVASYARAHPEKPITVNLSAGVYRRRLLGLRACDGTCDVCSAARRLTELDVLVCAAPGNLPGRTACPGTLAVRDPDIAVVSTALGGYDDSGYGSVAVHVSQLPRPVILNDPDEPSRP